MHFSSNLNNTSALIRIRMLALCFVYALIAGCNSGFEPSANPNPILSGSAGVADDGTGTGTGTGTHLALAPHLAGTTPDAGLACAFVRGALRGTPDADDENCIYEADLINANTPLTQDVRLASLPGGGAHIFMGSLVVGQSYATTAALGGAQISAGGDGPTLTIAAGATVAFANPEDFLMVNRGSQIVAGGAEDNPITFTSVADLTRDVDDDDIAMGGEWVGIIINGFAVTNECEYTGVHQIGASAGDPVADNELLRLFDDGQQGATGGGLTLFTGTPALTAVSGCHRASTLTQTNGSVVPVPIRRGGNNSLDKSGDLRYVIIKHAGASAGTISGHGLAGVDSGAFPGAALHLLSVGHDMALHSIQIFSSSGNGISHSGGWQSNQISHLITGVQGHGIRYGEGWHGSAAQQLIVQEPGMGDDCFHVAGSTLMQRTQSMNTRLAIIQSTCIFTPNRNDDSASGGEVRAGSGVVAEVNSYLFMFNSLIVGSRMAADATNTVDNRCLDVANSDGLILASIIACAELRAIAGPIAAERDDTNPTQYSFTLGLLDHLVGGGAGDGDPTATADDTLLLLEGRKPAVFSVPTSRARVNDIIVDDHPTNQWIGTVMLGGVTPASVGAVTEFNNVFAPWTFGVFPEPTTP